MLPSLEEVIAIILAWFRRQVWGLIKVAWWWSFRATPRMRLCATEVMFLIVLQVITLLRDAGVFRSGRVPKLVLRIVEITNRYLDDWQARATTQSSQSPSGGVG